MAQKQENVCEKLWMGPGTYEVPLELFSLNRARLTERLRAENFFSAIALLQGGNEVPFYDTDVVYNNFRQESFFMWTFGVIEPGFYGALEVATGEAHLFIPRFNPSYEIWMGPLRTPEYYGRKYGIPNTYYVDELYEVLNNLNPSNILLLNGINSDSHLPSIPTRFNGMERFKIDHDVLHDIISELRVFKTDFELDVMKYVIRISSEAHRLVMRMAKPGKSEYQCESEFLHYCYSVGGCRYHSYTCICCSGPNASVLHYGHAAAPNNRFIKPGEMVLFDMGANYFGYAADITCSFPVEGKFSPDQKLIYEAVLKANRAVAKAAKPGVFWSDMHELANRVLLIELKAGGILKGDVDKMMEAGLGGIFQPHGLGHLLGLDVHDVGGYLPNTPSRPTKPRGVEYLRTARVLETRMVLTIEPGCYFIDTLLNEALSSPQMSEFFVPEEIERFRGFGGVRIEDNVVVTEHGVEDYTRVPRTVEEIENFLAGKDDDKYNF